jgi:pimeloyl-ACP methyl ester carboxylesterase
MTFPEFQYAFVNSFPEDERRKYYDWYVVPESGRLFFQAAFAQLDPHHALHVNWENDKRAPSLLIAGGYDHLVPAHVVRSNDEHYKAPCTHTDFHEFDGRPHLFIAGQGWQDVADFVLSWLQDHKLSAEGTEAATAA